MRNKGNRRPETPAAKRIAGLFLARAGCHPCLKLNQPIEASSELPPEQVCHALQPL